MKMKDYKFVMPMSAARAVKVLKDDGVIVGKVVVNRYKFLRRCSLLGVNHNKVLEVLWR